MENIPFATCHLLFTPSHPLFLKPAEIPLMVS
jgi:hypothetical protein